MSNKWYVIIENDSFIIEYNKETNTYRVSYFEDNHFKDEICFRGYKELEAPEKTYTLEDFEKSLEDVKKIVDTYEPSTYNSPYCVNCPNHPNNGGNGICNCTLGLPKVTYDTPYTTHTPMITDGCVAKDYGKKEKDK